VKVNGARRSPRSEDPELGHPAGMSTARRKTLCWLPGRRSITGIPRSGGDRLPVQIIFLVLMRKGGVFWVNEG